MGSTSPTYRIASIPCDGIGPEVVSATIQVIKQLSTTIGTFNIEFTHIPWGTHYYKKTGRYAPADCLDTLRKFDAGLFGAVGDPDVPDHISLWGLLLAIRGPLQLYANVRPVRTFPGTKCPLNTIADGIDWVLVRENSEGEYSGQGGRSHVGHPWEAATEVAMFTRVGVERIMRFAFETARSRPRRQLTVVTKSNSMRNGMVLWDEVAAEVAPDFPEVKWDKMLVDAMTVRMVSNPQSLDTIVGTNLHMDILSDLAAALAGSIGVAPSSNLDPTRKNPSLFEPVHGSAFDITGKGVANPVATFWSAAEMLSWLGEKEAAKQLMDCVEKVCAAGVLTPDLGGSSNTQGVVDAVYVIIMESSDLTTGPSEIGSLRAHSNEESQFVGSSSGVYFINTVRQAFLKNRESLDNSSSEQGFPPPEDTLVGSDGDKRSIPGSSAHASPLSRGEHTLCRWEYDPSVAAVLGHAPPLETARELMMLYFRIWHPLFPFLHGPTFLQAMEQLYSGSPDSHAQSPSSTDHRNACWTTIFQCVFNLANHLRADVCLPPESQIESPGSMHKLLGTLTYRSDLPSLQALLASQLYLVAKMSLRTASTVGGCLLRSMVHAGLHRCPFRYKELSTHDRQLRKRIFWCSYALDRYLSQALGLPLGIQDSDIDVCLPGGYEAHIPGSHKTYASHSSNQDNADSPSPSPASYDQECANKKQLAFSSYVESGTLTGRALELFHKSIFVRSVRRSSVLVLVTDIHKWWNSLSTDLQGLPPRLVTDDHHHRSDSTSTSTSTTPFHFGPFFTVLYQHLILLVNRPSLSLAPSSPEFGSALQTCIGAAREILTALSAQLDSGQALFWPGFLSAAWMAGLYGLAKGYQWVSSPFLSHEINKCLVILHAMSAQWDTAKHCHRALSLLAHHIHQSPSILLQPTQPQLDQEGPSGSRAKRRRLESESEPCPDGGTAANNPPTPATSQLPQESTVASLPPSQTLLSDIADSRFFFRPEDDTTTTSLVDLDLGMVDLLQGGNFDNLLDMFGQQYPSF
ncbi:tartrate dehydrogenase [Aspergillus ambiguus]|uniref:tartrate dehydrogenase n=1 Tax=Aspergillus ambiguus TaxID=176160 RepID=UPI003CCE375A